MQRLGKRLNHKDYSLNPKLGYIVVHSFCRVSLARSNRPPKEWKKTRETGRKSEENCKNTCAQRAEKAFSGQQSKKHEGELLTF